MRKVPQGIWRVIILYPARVIGLCLAIIYLLNEFELTALSQEQTQAITGVVAALIILIAGFYDYPDTPTIPTPKRSDPISK